MLRSRDPKLGVWIDRIGTVPLRRQRHQFGALCRSILAQQLGSRAAATIHSRFLQLFTPDRSPSPAKVLSLREETLNSCGISRPKVRYLRALAREYHEGALGRVRLGSLDDDDVVKLLTGTPGIGVWTAEMFLIFSLGRPDVFSVGDLALRTGVERVEEMDLTPAEIVEVAARWSPYRSVASLYLWKIAHWKDD